MQTQEQLRKELYNNIVIRKDVYATQEPNGAYYPVKKHFFPEIYTKGKQTTGSYLLDKNDKVKCFVIDIDLNKKYVDEARGDISEYLPLIQKQTRAINDVFIKHGCKTLLEFSGNRGYHIWGFLSHTSPAVGIRSVLLELEKQFPEIDKEKLHWEIFPKQDYLEKGGLGNLIKMPLTLHQKSGNYSYLVDEDFNQYTPDTFPSIDPSNFLEIHIPNNEPVKNSTISTRVEINSDSKAPKFPPFNLERMEISCEKLKEKIQKVSKNHHIDHDERIWLANLYLAYGPVGKQKLHDLFEKLSDYKPDETEKHLSKLRGIPSLCSRVCGSNPCTAIKNTSWKSPIGFGYQPDPSQLFPKQGRYCVAPNKKNKDSGDRILTDWLISPIEVVDLNDRDVLKCSITSQIGTRYPEVYLENSAWHSKQKLLRALGHSELTFHGYDLDVQNLAHYVAKQVPKRRKGIDFIGMYEDTFVADGLNITKKGINTDPDILVYAPGEDSLQKRVKPDIDVNDSEYHELIEGLYKHLPNINKPGIIFPLLSWMFLLPFKSRIMKLKDAFPILLVYGEQGSGKTSTEELMLEMYGFQDHSVTSCRITQFAMLSLLSSTNCIPVVLDEFRASDMRSHQVDFIKDRIRLAYKESLDSRGKVDLTVRNYKMRAPLVLSGEHKISEPAIMERVICGAFDQDLKNEGSASYTDHFNLLKTFHLQGFLPRYVQWSLGEDIGGYFERADEYLQTLEFYKKAPSRTKFNLSCLYCGLELWSEYGKHNNVTPQDIPFKDVFDFQKDELNLSDAGRHKRDVDILLETVAVLAERGEVMDGVEYTYHGTYRKEENGFTDALLIRVKPIIGALRKYKQQTGDDINVMDEQSFRTQILKAPYFLEFKRFSYKGKQQRWCVLDYSEMLEREFEVEGFYKDVERCEDAPALVVDDIFEHIKSHQSLESKKEVIEYVNYKTGDFDTDEIPF
jgi:hypothetical protein